MTVYELLQVPSLKNNLKVIAGESGLDRKISSVTVIDTPDGLNWLRGNEVVITTAYAVSDKEETFIEFTKEVIHKGISALVVKLDRYLKEIPEEAIGLANKEHFPLISCPGEFAFCDIINPVLSNIISVQASELEESSHIHKSFIELAIKGSSIPEILYTLSDLIKSPVLFIDKVFEKNYFSDENEKYEDYCENISDYTDEYEYFVVEDKKRQYGYLVDLTERNKMAGKNDWEINIYKTAIEYASIVIILRMQMRISNTMIEEKYKTSFVEDLFFNNVKTIEEIRTRAQLYGWDFKEGGFVVLVDINNIKKNYLTKLDPEENSKLQNYTDCIFRASIQYMQQFFPTSKYYKQSDTVAFLISDDYTPSVKGKLKEAFHQIQKYLSNVVPFTITMAVGEYVDRIINIHKSYEQAKRVVELGYQMEKFDCIMFYDEMGIYRLLFSISDQSETVVFCKKYMEPLELYDTKNHADLLKTLDMIIECGWNIKEASQKLFIHYNSAKYRFQKICEILDMDLKDVTLHTEVELAMKLYQMRRNTL